jgi:hypothetical protein
MAQWRIDQQKKVEQNSKTLYELGMIATVNGDPVTNANPFPVSLGSNNITITGNVNVGTTVQVSSTPENPVHTHISEVGNSGILTVSYMPVSGNVVITSGNLNSNVTGIVNVGNFPASQNVVVTSGNINITSTVTVITTQEAGDLYAFNNHAINTNRGWTMDDTMRPVVSFRNNSASVADLIKIIEYEIGNNNANQSTIVYEWYEGDLTITGAAIPAWTTFGVHSQYRVYQDKYSSNQGNTFTPNGSIMRHSGIIIGKNTSGDEGPASMHGGGTPNMLTLCMRRVDNSTKLDVWFAFTIKELS